VAHAAKRQTQRARAKTGQGGAAGDGSAVTGKIVAQHSQNLLALDERQFRHRSAGT
jgi:hypothetical protein